MEVIVVVSVSGGDVRGAVGFPGRPWRNVNWRGYPGQWVEEGVFGMVSRLLSDMRIVA